MEKRIVFALLVVAILAAAAMPLNSLTSVPHRTQATLTAGSSTTTTPTTEWNKTYGGTGTDEASSVQQTFDGGYIVAGYTSSFGAGGGDFWLVKTDSSGHVEWNKTYGGGVYDKACSVQRTSDGGYAMAGQTTSFGAGEGDFWLVKTDSIGDEQWNKTYGGTEGDVAYSLQQTSDGGYVMAGYTTSFGAGSYDFWLVKTDSSGNMQWNKTFGGTGGDYASSVQQTSDGGYVVAGYTISFGVGGYKFWLVKTDSTGDERWNKTYGGTGVEFAYSVQQTSDDGYIMAGYTTSFGAGSRDAWLVKIDSSGNPQWNKTYGGASYDYAYSVQQTSDGGYIVAGYTFSFGAGGTDAWLVKTDSLGNPQWNKTYGGPYHDETYSVQQTSDGGYIAAGYRDSLGISDDDFWLIKTGDGTPPSTISDLAAGSPTSNSTALTWTAPGDDGYVGNATGYVVKYSTVGPIDSGNWNLTSIYTQFWTPVRNGTLETHLVTGLTPGMEYWFAVEAYDDVLSYGGVSNSPNVITATTSTTTTQSDGGSPFSGQMMIAAAAVGVVILVLLVVLYSRKRW